MPRLRTDGANAMPPSALILPTCIAGALERRRTLEPTWSEVDWTPHAEPLPAVLFASDPPSGAPSTLFPTTWPVAIEDQLLECFATLERHAQAHRRFLTIAVRCWRDRQQIRLKLTASAAGACVAVCRWNGCCRPEMGGAPRRQRRLRLIVPSLPPPSPRPPDERDRSLPVCLLRSGCRGGALLEQFHHLQRRLPYSKLWTTDSPRLARLWLANHPDCPLFAAEVRSEAGFELQLSSPAFTPTAAPIAVVLPVTTADLLNAVRRICHCMPGNAA